MQKYEVFSNFASFWGRKCKKAFARRFNRKGEGLRAQVWGPLFPPPFEGGAHQGATCLGSPSPLRLKAEAS